MVNEVIGNNDKEAIQNIINRAQYNHTQSILFCYDKPTLKEISPLLTHLVDKQNVELPQSFVTYDTSKDVKQIEFYNGNTLKLGMLRNRYDHLRYQGSMFDGMFFYEPERMIEKERWGVMAWLRSNNPKQLCEAYLYYRSQDELPKG